MIHIDDVRANLNSKKECDIVFVKKSGEVVRAKNIVCTSSFYQNNTFNILFLQSREVRKIHALLIIQFNGQEVFL